MAAIVITEVARAQIIEGLVSSEAEFGSVQGEEYERLILQALEDLSEFPNLGAARPEIHADARVFPLARRGHRARHLLIYRVRGETVEVARGVHDAMRLEPPSEWDR